MFFEKKTRRRDFKRQPLESVSNPEDEKKRSRFLSLTVFILVATLFCVTTAYVLFWAPFLKINEIVIVGEKQTDARAIREDVQSYLNEKLFTWIPGNSLLSVSERKLAEKVLADFKNLKKVEARKIFPDKLEIKLEEREALMVFCRSEKRGDDCYLLDEKGEAYARADFYSEELTVNNLVMVTDLSGEEVRQGEQIYEREKADFIFSLQKDFFSVENWQFKPVYLIPSRLAEEVRLRAENGTIIFISTKIAILESVKKLQVFLRQEAKKDSPREFEYIDLRVENRVYYKTKGVREEMENGSEAESNLEDINNGSDIVQDEKSKEKKKKNK